MPLGNRHVSPLRPATPDNCHQRHFSFKPTWMQKLLNHSIFLRDESRCQSPDAAGDGFDTRVTWPSAPLDSVPNCQPLERDSQRPVTGLPRQTTFERQNSERRERLCPVDPSLGERRTASATRHASTSCVRRRRTRSSPPPVSECRASAPIMTENLSPSLGNAIDLVETSPEAFQDTHMTHPVHHDNVFDYEERPSRPLSRASSVSTYDDQRRLQADLDTKWILNLSMHFRDKSDREKFFVTYAETPTRWRRVTVSCDYRHAEPGSLEMDLKELQFQRDKSLAIYEAIHESLPDIQFYDTVTNLKLETSQGRLHVHVTEDINEIIPYPPRDMVRHVLNDPDTNARPMELCERDVAFDAHLSGFVYRVWYGDKVYIKKEIPSPDTIDEFLYEINALHALNHSPYVIKLEAIILDDTRQVVKGLLISLAERGAIVDILYEKKGLTPWAIREQWARQAIIGLRDIHEEGYVQGDFTLSNIVVDDNNDAKIIDINRRGCPVGWEPPEIAQKIASSQRISMYIGEKSDIYQLGMTLWALAMDDDEPERHDPPLSTECFGSDIPSWYKQLVENCLSEKPRDRLSAKELVGFFPALSPPPDHELTDFEEPPRSHQVLRSEPKQYIDPNAAVERDDIERFRHDALLYSPQSSKDDYTFTYPRSSEYDHESCASIGDKNTLYDNHRKNGKPFDQGKHDTDDAHVFQYHGSFTDGFQALYSEQSSRDGNEVKANDLDLFPIHDYEFRNDSRRHSLQGWPNAAAIPPTLKSQSPSPFHLPVWHRSMSDTTPKDSKRRLLTESNSTSSQISPHSTTIALPDRVQVKDCPTTEADGDVEIVSACDVSIGETSYSGTTLSATLEPSGMKADDDAAQGLGTREDTLSGAQKPHLILTG